MAEVVTVPKPKVRLTTDPDDFSNLPEQLRKLSRFLVWKALPGTKPGKVRKMPFYASGAPRYGSLDTDKDLAQLVSFERACDTLMLDDYAGIGFAVGGGVGAFDLDDCLGEHGNLKQGHPGYDLVMEAKKRGAYVEVSPSRRGLRIIGPCESTEAYSAGGLEYWGARRFVTLTGEPFKKPGGWVALDDLRAMLPARQTSVEHEADDEGPIITPRIVDELRDALSAIPADDRTTWVNMGLALKADLPEAKARSLWDEWSRSSEKYDAADAERVWESMRPTSTGYRAVFAEADRHGWKNPRKRHNADRGEAGGLPIEWGEQIEPRLDALWLIKRTLPQIGLALIFGHPGSGKTFLALDMAAHIALGREWNGQRVRKGVVVYVCAEGQNGARNRIAAFRKHYGVDGDFPLALIPCSIDLHNPAADRGRLADAVRRAAEHYGEEPVLIIIDTISKTLGGGKENTDDLATYVANCGWLSSEFQCCVMPIHHRPKDQESSDPRGHGSLKGGLDTVILVEGGSAKRARITKQRDDEERDLLTFRLKVHELGRDEDGELVTSCTVEPVDAEAIMPSDPLERAVVKLRDGHRLIYDQLIELLDTEALPVPDEIPADEIDRNRVREVVLLDSFRTKAISAHGTDPGRKPDSHRRAFDRALETLRKRGIVRVWEDWVWVPCA